MTEQQHPNPYEAAYPAPDEAKGSKVPWLLLLVIFGALVVLALGGILTYTTQVRATQEALRARMEAEQARTAAEQARAEAEKSQAEKE